MKNEFTPVVSVKKQTNAKVERSEKTKCPSERTLTFLKLFARNCQVEKNLPEGLREMIIG